MGIKSLENLGEARVLSQVPTAEHGQARVLTELSSYQFDFRPRPPAKSPDSVCFLTNRQAGRQHALAQHGRQEAEKVGRFHERRVQAEVHGAQGQGQGRHHGRRGFCATQGGGSPDPAVLCGGLRGLFQEQPGPQLTHELLPRQHTWQHRVGNGPVEDGSGTEWSRTTFHNGASLHQRTSLLHLAGFSQSGVQND